jgi:hypothetical protein
VAQQGPTNGPLKLRRKDDEVVASQSFGNDPGSGANRKRCYPLDSGDPRSLTDVFPVYSEAGGSTSSIAWRRNAANWKSYTRLGADSHYARTRSSGLIPDNSVGGFVPEPVAPDINDPLEAVSVIRDGRMRTIGELGYIYDPAFPGDGYEIDGVVRKRGGFRTLAIGSKMGEATGPARLDHVDETCRASRLLELFTTREPVGSILLNSARRDAANLPLRAILNGLKTQMNNAPGPVFPAPRDPSFPAKGLDVNVDKVIEALSARGNPPFLFLGQLADLDIFNTGSDLFVPSFDITPTDANRKLLDRGREEVFRHLAGLLTLKGSTFRVYAIGQAGTMMANGRFHVRGTCRAMRLYRLERTYPETNPLKTTSMPELLENNRPVSVKARLLGEIR